MPRKLAFVKVKKYKIFVKNKYFSQNPNQKKKSKIWSKIYMLFKNRNIGENYKLGRDRSISVRYGVYSYISYHPAAFVLINVATLCRFLWLRKQTQVFKQKNSSLCLSPPNGHHKFILSQKLSVFFQVHVAAFYAVHSEQIISMSELEKYRFRFVENQKYGQKLILSSNIEILVKTRKWGQKLSFLSKIEKRHFLAKCKFYRFCQNVNFTDFVKM